MADGNATALSLLEKLPREMLQEINSYLDPVSSSLLALPSKTISSIVGTEAWDELDGPPHLSHKENFLSHLSRDLIGFELCVPYLQLRKIELAKGHPTPRGEHKSAGYDVNPTKPWQLDMHFTHEPRKYFDTFESIMAGLRGTPSFSLSYEHPVQVPLEYQPKCCGRFEQDFAVKVTLHQGELYLKTSHTIFKWKPDPDPDFRRVVRHRSNEVSIAHVPYLRICPHWGTDNVQPSIQPWLYLNHRSVCKVLQDNEGNDSVGDAKQCRPYPINYFNILLEDRIRHRPTGFGSPLFGCPHCLTEYQVRHHGNPDEQLPEEGTAILDVYRHLGNLMKPWNYNWRKHCEVDQGWRGGKAAFGSSKAVLEWEDGDDVHKLPETETSYGRGPPAVAAVP